MPKKGKCNKEKAQREGVQEFKTAKRKHSAVDQDQCT